MSPNRRRRCLFGDSFTKPFQPSTGLFPLSRYTNADSIHFVKKEVKIKYVSLVRLLLVWCLQSRRLWPSFVYAFCFLSNNFHFHFYSPTIWRHRMHANAAPRAHTTKKGKLMFLSSFSASSSSSCWFCFWFTHSCTNYHRSIAFNFLLRTSWFLRRVARPLHSAKMFDTTSEAIDAYMPLTVNWENCVCDTRVPPSPLPHTQREESRRS